MKKLFVSFLACLLCIAMLASCGRTTPTTEPTTPTTEPNNQGGDLPEMLTIVSNGASDYQIVVAEGADSGIVDIAYELRWVIKQLTGVDFSSALPHGRVPRMRPKKEGGAEDSAGP